MDDTATLLARWHDGDRGALQELVGRNLDWVKSKVRQRLGSSLRRVGESDDFVQETMLDFLVYSPRFRVKSEAQLRALLSKVVENAIRDQNDYWFKARRRSLNREFPVSSDTVLDLAPQTTSRTPPDEKVANEEMDALLRLAIELLNPDDRRVVVLRHWDNLTMSKIAFKIGMTADGARKRYERALPKLATILDQLKRGVTEESN